MISDQYLGCQECEWILNFENCSLSLSLSHALALKILGSPIRLIMPCMNFQRNQQKFIVHFLFLLVALIFTFFFLFRLFSR